MNVFDLAQEDTKLTRVARSTSKGNGSEYAGPCPGCGGTDRFHVQPDRKEHGAWMCRNCWPAEEKGWADNIEYLRWFRGMRFTDAKDYLASQVDSTLSSVRSLQRSVSVEPGEIPAEYWQKKYEPFVIAAAARLWTPEGQVALDYLRSRGLTDETIRKARLGYAIRNSRPCIVIPWFDLREKGYWRVSLRDITPGIPKEQRYKQTLPGFSSDGMYLGDSLLRKLPTFLVEGEIDALSLVQAAGDIVNVVATGSTGNGRVPKWEGRLARMPAVLVAFDREATGDKSAQYWLDLLDGVTTVLRYRPLTHDVNDMLIQGYDVRSWVEAALDYISDTPVSVEQVVPSLSTQEPVEQVVPASEFTCSVCSLDLTNVDQDTYVDENGVAYCSAHWKTRNVIPARFTSQEQFTQYVASLAAGPGWTATPLPAGYTLEQYVAKLPRKYIPATLPQLPRGQCPFEIVKVVGKGKDERIKVVPCTGETLENGWCKAHQEANTLLELGAVLGYPRVDQLGRYVDDYSRQTKYARVIGQGVGSWEAYAQRATATWLKTDLPTLRRMVDQQEQQSA